MMKTNPAMLSSAAYKAAMQRLEQASNPSQPPQVGGPQASQSVFGELLKNEMSNTIGALRQGEQTSLDALAGKASVQEVVEALGAAEFSLQKLTTVRDRVISAYQEIIRMPI